MTQTITERAAECGYRLPPVSGPSANYLPAVRCGRLLYISGQVSRTMSGDVIRGALGKDLSVEEGFTASHYAALHLVALIATETEDKLSRVRRVLRLGVFIASDPKFEELPQVANGASDLLAQVFGDAGQHSRSAMGVASLPRGAAVEIDAIVELEDGE